MNIVGLSCFYHDSAAALVQDGRLVAAAQEERFTRKKHDPSFPTQALRYCLQAGRLTPEQVDAVVFYDKPFVKFERILQTSIATFPWSFAAFHAAMPVWLKEKLWIPSLIRQEMGGHPEIHFSEHHTAHAASAFLVSPFEEAAILTVDGVGEWETTTTGIGRGNSFTLDRSIWFPHSLGLLYSAFTYYLGFRVNSAEYKVMGLAPYGEPRFADLIRRELIDLREDGSFRLNLRYFRYHFGLTMTGRRLERLFGEPRREPEGTLSQFHKDVAASIQRVTDQVVVSMAREQQRRSGLRALCMAGGVALNCVSNSKILEETEFQDVFVQPAAGDAGGAVGAAFYHHHVTLGHPRSFQLEHVFFGPAFDDASIETFLRAGGIPYERYDREGILRETARAIAGQKVVGWFQGRMEFGPRSLGSRSILADARNPKNQSIVNLKIKFRESFRPFAPTVLAERTGDWFMWKGESPYMLFVATVREDRRTIPAVTHVDGSARLQTIARHQHPMYYDLLAEFERQTGCPVIINTSFNVRGEPIVCTPKDAWKCFMRTEMDVLVLGSFIVHKDRMTPDLMVELEDIELD